MLESCSVESSVKIAMSLPQWALSNGGQAHYTTMPPPSLFNRKKKKQRLSTSIACPTVSEVCAVLPRVLRTAPVKSQCFYVSRLFLTSNSFYVITCLFLLYLTFVNIYAKLLCPFAWTVFSHVLRTCVGSNKFFEKSFTASQVPV